MIKGNWTYDSTDCSLENNDSETGNVIWFGSEDGLTPNNDFVHETFNLTVTMAVHSGDRAGLLFRTQKSSTIDREGPTYTAFLRFEQERMCFRVYKNGSIEDLSKATTVYLDHDSVYTLTVHAAADIYNFYVNGTLVMADINRTYYDGGSFAVMTEDAIATFYSLEYECMYFV